MTPFTELSAPACPLAKSNVDTDQLIPARFMKEPRNVGYGQFLLYDLRYEGSAKPVRDFILNQPGADQAEIMVSRRNFGAGSSREAAVYALVDFGFRCVIAPSFGDIFSSNAVNNGLLPALVSEADADRLLEALGTEFTPLTVDLVTQQIRYANQIIPFDINAVWKTKLLNGWDDIDLTEGYRQSIDTFVEHYQNRFPWTQGQPEGALGLIARDDQ